jgi:signal transduction histidine kinase
MELSRMVERVGRHRYLVLAVVFALMAGQEIVEMAVLEQPSMSGSRFPLGPLLHVLQIVAIVSGTYVLIDAFRRTSALAAAERRRAGELASLLEELREKERVLSATMERLTVVQEDERRLVAYDIHDSLAQVIVSAKQHLDTGADLCRCPSARVRSELGKARDRLDRAIVETRRLLASLRPGTLDSLGLVPALRALVDETARQGGWRTELVAEVGEERLPPTIETGAYRIAQEALTNALKHARTSRIALVLRREPERLILEIRDWGTGFVDDPAQRRGSAGLGLVSMRERARLLGGQCRVESAPGRGTAVRAELPLTPSRSYAAAH